MKKIISVFLSICICLCLFTPVCFADDSVYDHTHNWVKEKIHSYSLEYNGVAFGIDVFKCSECALYLHTLKFLGYEVPVIRASPDTALGSEAAAMCAQAMVAIFGKEWYATKFEAGGGSASPGGVGRNPSGYSGQGMPTVNSSGVMFLSVPFEGYMYSYISGSYSAFEWITQGTYEDTKKSSYFNTKPYFAGSPGEKMYPDMCDIIYTFTAPVDGIYFYSYLLNGYSVCDIKLYSDRKGVFESKYSINWSDNMMYFKAKHLNKGEVVHFKSEYWLRGDCNGYDNFTANNSITVGKFSFNPALICFEPDPDSSTLSNQTNITINNNTFNGNIYVDNTNKLTYIYPQYTVNNETKISNNPIIYNEETKQYYTYDQTTNNYYYITYGDPAPTPTPSPSPDPGGSTPDPGKPTPTPTPGGSDSSGDGSGSNPFKWLGELFKDILDGIIKGLWKIITSIFGFILWLLSLLFKLFPWMPNSALVALCGGVVVVTIIRIIKFITGR